MLITIATESDVLSGVDISAIGTVAELKTFVGGLLSRPATALSILYNGRVLEDAETTAQTFTGATDVLVQVLPTSLAPSPAPAGGGLRSLADLPTSSRDPQVLMDLLLKPENERVLRELAFQNEPLAAAIRTGSVAEVRKVQMQQILNGHKTKHDREQRDMWLWANADSEEAQKEIAERIRLEEVNKQMELAMEESPESFGSVHMLYVDSEINGIQMQMFIDSGAQMTIMSLDCARRCNLERFIDGRWKGEARGVGSGKIVGRIHLAQMKIGSTYLQVTFTILESQDIDVIFGLDMLKRHQCCIDLQKGVLRVVGHGLNEEVSFLGEAEIRERAQGKRAFGLKDIQSESKGEEGAASPHQAGPDGMDVSGSSGPDPALAPQAPVPTPNPNPWATANPGLAVAVPLPAAAAEGVGANGSTEAVAMLTGLGFTQEQARAALVQTGGNAELAAQLLFEGGA